MDEKPTQSPKSDESISGFVQNLSPIKVGPSKKYFDFNLQTETNTAVRGICFSPQKRKLFDESQEKSTPIKIKKFVHDKKEGSTDILMSDNVVIDHLEVKEVSFPRKDLVPNSLNLSMLGTISLHQLITVKGKIIGLQQPQKVKMPECVLNKVDALLVDPHGSVKIVLWEDDIHKVKEGETYKFKNLRIKKNKNSGELYVNPAKGNCVISKCAPFKDKLAVPEHIPTEFITSNIEGQVMGIHETKIDHCCYKCNKWVKPQKIVQCDNPNCNLKQKLETCKKQWFLKALISHKDTTVDVIFRHDSIIQALLLSDAAVNTSTLSEEVITDIFLSLPTLSITYEKRTKVVKEVSKLYNV